MSDELNHPSGHCVGPDSKEAGVASSCAGCPNAKICASRPKSKEDPDLPALTKKMARIRHKLIILSGKGGVGKSTFTKELGFSLSQCGFNVGICDVDLCGPSMPRMTGVIAEEMHQSANGWEPVLINDHLSLVSMQFFLSNPNTAVTWRGPQKNGMIKKLLLEVDWGDLDFLLFDTPPGTTDEHISLIQFLQSSMQPNSGLLAGIVVTTPQLIAIANVRREINFCNKIKLPVLGIVENMSYFICPCCGHNTNIFASDENKQSHSELLAKEYNIALLGRIPLAMQIMQSSDEGNSVLEEDQCYIHDEYNKIINQIKQLIVN